VKGPRTAGLFPFELRLGRGAGIRGAERTLGDPPLVDHCDDWISTSCSGSPSSSTAMFGRGGLWLKGAK